MRSAAGFRRTISTAKRVSNYSAFRTRDSPNSRTPLALDTEAGREHPGVRAKRDSRSS